jgi:hypothetical protein
MAQEAAQQKAKADAAAGGQGAPAASSPDNTPQR